MKKELTCVICPNGCELLVEYEGTGELTRVIEVKGQLCKKGPKWAERELVSPVRSVCTSVLVEAGELPLVSVRTSSPVPLASIPELMEEIKRIKVKAPVHVGQVILSKPRGLKTNVIATRDVGPRI